MAVSITQIAELYVATFNRAADQGGLNYWAGVGTDVTELTTIEDIASAFLESPEAVATIGDDREALVTSLYQNVLGRDGNAAEINYWTNISETPSSELVLAFINGALGPDKDYLDNKTEVALAYAQAGLTDVGQAYSIMNAITADDATVAAAIADINEAAGIVTPDVATTQYLTTGVDHLTGGDAADTFIADLNQVEGTGNVANTLATGDTLNGGASTDTLEAQLSAQMEGTGFFSVTDAQPRTTSIENVKIEAQDYSYQHGNNGGWYGTFNTAYLDAKHMTGVEKIGSSYSDGDLIIENLTTLTDGGEIRNTSAMTITMDHTDNFDHDKDASDLTVLFDEDYLNRTTTTQGSTLTVKINNVLNIADGGNPVANFTGINFTVGGTAVSVDITGATSYAQVVSMINAQLATQGLNTVSASLAPAEQVAFSMNIGTHTTGEIAGTFNPITITNTGPETLVKGTIDLAQGQTDGDINNTWEATPSIETNNPISINVELEKVGRDGEGGNLIVGGKEAHGGIESTDVDKQNGIEVFNITVKGDEDRPSNLGFIISTNATLTTVNIASETRTDDSYAALTVRGDDTAPFGGTLDTLNANAFLGDLYIGQDASAQNIDTFTATGGGDVTLYENITGISASVTTGAGADTLDLSVYKGGSVSVNSGSGNDKVDVYLADSATTATINAGAGNDTVTMTGTGSATINGGAGNDVIKGNTVAVNVTDGAGNDAVYVQNTGAKAQQTVATSTQDGGAQTLGSINPGAHDPLDSELMYGRSVKVTVAAPNKTGIAANSFTEGFESVSVNVVTDGYVSTLAEYNAAIVKAINEDATLSDLAHAYVDTAGDVVVNYLVDGVVDTAGDVEVEISGSWADLSTAKQTAITNAFIAKYSDSTITSAEVGAAYDGITTDVNNSTATQVGTASNDGTANSVTLSGGDDFIALSSEGTDTVIFDAHTQIGNDTLVNFDLDADKLDFTAFLQDMQDASNNTNHDSAVRIATTISVENAAGIDLTSNEVAVVNDFSANGSQNWANMSANSIDTALTVNGNSYGNIADGATTIAANAYESTQASILMVENNANAGEYKVFEVTETTASDSYSVTLIGTVDFGHQIDATAVVV